MNASVAIDREERNKSRTGKLMMRAVAFVVLGLLISFSAARAEPCKSQGFADAKELTFDWRQQDLRRGFFASVELGLSSPTFPMKNIEKIVAPCSRGKVTIGSDEFELFGEDDYDSAPRWAVSVTKTDTLYFATDRKIFVLFDSVPTDERLKEAIKDVGEGGRASFATYNDIKYPPKFELKAPTP